MGREGLMTPEEAERKVWEFYWQLDGSIDRRTAPLKFEPPDRIEMDREKRDRYQGLWGRVQRQVDRWFTHRKRDEYLEGAASDMLEQARVDRDNRGRVDYRTGLVKYKYDFDD